MHLHVLVNKLSLLTFNCVRGKARQVYTCIALREHTRTCTCTVEPLYSGHLGDLWKCPYIERCPYIEKCPPYSVYKCGQPANMYFYQSDLQMVVSSYVKSQLQRRYVKV